MASAGAVSVNSTSASSVNSESIASRAAAPTATPPLASQSTFELYDPRGLLTRRRSQTRPSNAAATASPGERGTRAAVVGGGRDRRDSTATHNSLTSVQEDGLHGIPRHSEPTSSPGAMATAKAGTTAEPVRLARLQISNNDGFSSPSANKDALTEALTSSLPDLRARQVESAADAPISQSLWHSDSDSTRSPQASYISHRRPPAPQRFYSGSQTSESGDNSSIAGMSSSDILSPAAEFLSSFSASKRGNLPSRAPSESVSNGQSYQTPEGSAMFLDTASVGATGGSTRRGSEAGSTSFLRSFIAPDPDDEGEEVDGYVLEEIIGQGSFSTVRRARHIASGELVAVKIVRHSCSPSYHPTGRQGISWSDAKLGSSFIAESVNGQANGPKRVKRDSSRTRQDITTGESSKSGRFRNRRGRSCSSPSLPLKSFSVDGLPPSSENDYYQMASSMTIDSSDSQASTPSYNNRNKFASNRSSDEEDMQTEIQEGDISLADPALQREVSIWSQLDQHHPYILPLLHYYEDSFASYIFMPLCERNLLQYVKSYGNGGSKSPALRESSPPSLSASVSQLSKLPPSAAATSTPARNMSQSSLSQSNFSSSLPPSGVKLHRSSSIRIRPAGEIPTGGAGLPFDQAKKIFAQIVVGLRYLHTALNITHKDIKLENILMDDKGNFKISDFGLAYAPSLTVNTAFSTGPPTGDSNLISPMSSPGSGPVTANPFKDDPKLRREHALSDGDAQLLNMRSNYMPPSGSGYPSGAVAFNSFGHAASTLLPSTDSPDKSMNCASPVLGATDSLSSSVPPSAFPVTQPSVAQRRARQHHAIPTSVMTHGGAGAFDAAPGSLQYTSPEQIRSPSPISSLAVDIWALGCVLYALIDGRLPFDDGFEPRLRVNIMKAQWKLPEVLKAPERIKSKVLDSATMTASPSILPQDDGDAAAVGAETAEPLEKERKQVEELLLGCLQLDVAKRWSIQDVAKCAWLKEAISAIEAESCLSPSSETVHTSRGRKGADLDIASEDRKPHSAIPLGNMFRDGSRGRRSDLFAYEQSHESSRSSSRPASSRRGPSTDEYRAARAGRSSSRNSRVRSDSRQRRYGGEAVNTWEII